ncbi:unnamed protein product [Gongylonema pulchrum]|uniref:Uncharacterized protein n=1 Tax=Gongylonema pulchrum TaxID=637853 RepID=A0A183EHW7_9BILA|nr:unnamed protein product [Gongylonema pulchrum]
MEATGPVHPESASTSPLQVQACGCGGDDGDSHLAFTLPGSKMGEAVRFMVAPASSSLLFLSSRCSMAVAAAMPFPDDELRCNSFTMGEAVRFMVAPASSSLLFLSSRCSMAVAAAMPFPDDELRCNSFTEQTVKQRVGDRSASLLYKKKEHMFSKGKPSKQKSYGEVSLRELQKLCCALGNEDESLLLLLSSVEDLLCDDDEPDNDRLVGLLFCGWSDGVENGEPVLGDFRRAPRQTDTTLSSSSPAVKYSSATFA